MDTSDSKISFDSNGVCDHCQGFFRDIEPNWHTDAEERARFQATIDKIKEAGKGQDFDCIMGMSGGVDSSYLTHLAVEEFGLRPLVFHVDAGWNSQEAVNNIERLVEALDLDLFTEVIDWEEMKDLQLSFFKSGVAHLDTPQDHAFFATMYNFAAQYGVKYILTGANFATEAIKNPLEWHYHASDLRQLKDIHEKFGSRPLKRFPLANVLRYKIYYRYIKGVRVVRPLDHVPYVKQDAIKLLTEKYGWQTYPQKHFESRFTKFYEAYWQPVRFGIDKRRVQFSSLILSGQMNREDALTELKSPAFDEESIDREFEFIATKLGISVDELKNYLEIPIRSYSDYKSQMGTYILGTKVLKALGMERRVIR